MHGRRPAIAKFSRTAENVMLYIWAARIYSAVMVFGKPLFVTLCLETRNSVYKIPSATATLMKRFYGIAAKNEKLFLKSILVH